MLIKPFLMNSGWKCGDEIPTAAKFAKELSAILERIPAAASDTKKWTYSGWVKLALGESPANRVLLSSGDSTNYTGVLRINANGAVLIHNFRGTSDYLLSSKALMRDTTNHFHVHVVFDSAAPTPSDRIKITVNGQRLTEFTTENYPAQDFADGFINSASRHTIGSYAGDDTMLFEGYQSAVHFIDGQALGVENFGKVCPITGHWVPVNYAGAHGTNGFHLDFADAGDLGKDVSGNGNHFTNNNVVQSTDTPTNNHVLWLATVQDYQLKNAGLSFVSVADYGGTGEIWHEASIAIPAEGKYYFEVTVDSMTGSTSRPSMRIKDRNDGSLNAEYRGEDGTLRADGSIISTQAGYGVGDCVGMAIDSDAGTIEFFKNGVSQDVISYDAAGKVLSVAEFDSIVTMGFTLNNTIESWLYSPPAGFNPLSTGNLPEPAVVKSADAFGALAFDDGASAKSLGFSPDLVWLKARDATTDHKIVDSVRGATKAISSNTTAAESTDASGLTSFDAYGFTVGGDSAYSNTAGDGMAAWAWMKGPQFGLDIVEYIGTGVAQDIGHNLGAVPEFILVKNLDTVSSWRVYHKDIGPDSGLKLNLNDPKLSSSAIYWNNTAPAAGVFSVGTEPNSNENGSRHIAYVFSGIEGLSKFGKYIGNGSEDGPVVNLGFSPAFLLVKRADFASNWILVDVARSPLNLMDEILQADLNSVESGSVVYDALANGFKVRHSVTNYNVAGGEYIYAAFAKHPFKYSNAR